MEDIEHYSIRIYNFPYDVEEDDEDTIEENSELRVRLSIQLERTSLLTPFVGSFAVLHHW
jgi:hypothetical protein